MENDGWLMINYSWSMNYHYRLMVDDRWSVYDDRWSVDDDVWPVVDLRRRMIDDRRTIDDHVFLYTCLTRFAPRFIAAPMASFP